MRLPLAVAVSALLLLAAVLGRGAVAAPAAAPNDGSAAAAAVEAPAPGPGTPPSAAARQLRIVIKGLRRPLGHALVAIFAAKDGFPGSHDKAVRRVLVPVTGSEIETVVEGLAAGTYAVSVIHDENDNRKLDTNWIGIPKEGMGASNDAKGSFGPPSFEKASFSLGAAAPAQTIVINMVYL